MSLAGKACQAHPTDMYRASSYMYCKQAQLLTPLAAVPACIGMMLSASCLCMLLSVRMYADASAYM